MLTGSDGPGPKSAMRCPMPLACWSSWIWCSKRDACEMLFSMILYGLLIFPWRSHVHKRQMQHCEFLFTHYSSHAIIFVIIHCSVRCCTVACHPSLGSMSPQAPPKTMTRVRREKRRIRSSLRSVSQMQMISVHMSPISYNQLVLGMPFLPLRSLLWPVVSYTKGYLCQVLFFMIFSSSSRWYDLLVVVESDHRRLCPTFQWLSDRSVTFSDHHIYYTPVGVRREAAKYLWLDMLWLQLGHLHRLQITSDSIRFFQKKIISKY